MSLLYELITKKIEENINTFDWYELSRNPSAIPLLEQYPEKINWNALSSNPNAIELLEKYPDKINWIILAKNPNAIELLTKNPKKINWAYLSENPNAIGLLTENPKKINWKYLSMNPNAIELLTENPDKIEWEFLDKNINLTHMLEKIPFNILKKCDDSILESISKNSFTIDFLGKYPEIIIWKGLYQNEKICDFEERYPKYFKQLISNDDWDWINIFLNPFAVPLIEKYKKAWISNVHKYRYLSTNPNAIDFLKKNINLINYAFLSENPNAIDLLEANIDKVNFHHLSKNTNPNIWRDNSYILK